MSRYAIHKFLCQLRNDAAFQQRAQADPLAVVDELSLTAEERDALTRGDVRQLYDMGIHAYLIQQLSIARLFGVNRDNYFPRIRGEMAVE